MGRVLHSIATYSAGEGGFGVYVPCVSDGNRVIFYAQDSKNGAGIVAWDGGRTTRVPVPRGMEVCSHPDRDAAGRVCFYARTDGEGAPLVLVDGDDARVLATRCGPLGPTMNDRGDIAFRAEVSRGVQAVLACRSGRVEVVACTGSRFAAFHGLPVVCADGSVVARADLVRGEGVVLVIRADGTERLIASTERGFMALGLFPCANARGDVAFAGVDPAGRPGAWIAGANGVLHRVHDGSGFESIRGVLIDDDGVPVLLATPSGGRLGVYVDDERVLGVGDAVGGTVAEFALNPVSIGPHSELAARVRLASGDEHIVLCLRT